MEEEHRVLTLLSLHENFPEYHGTFLKKSGNNEDHQIWFVMEVRKRRRGEREEEVRKEGGMGG